MYIYREENKGIERSELRSLGKYLSCVVHQCGTGYANNGVDSPMTRSSIRYQYAVNVSHRLLSRHDSFYRPGLSDDNSRPITDRVREIAESQAHKVALMLMIDIRSVRARLLGRRMFAKNKSADRYVNR